MVCLLTMVLAAVGALSTAVAGTLSGVSMAGMSSVPASGIFGLLAHWGPWILGTSVGLITLSLGLRRTVLGVPAFVTGAVVYWAMYGQSRLSVMIVVSLAGFGGWGYLFYRAPSAAPSSSVRSGG